jgi:hypothetical protein
MPLDIESLLLGDDDAMQSPERAAALAGALKRQRNYGLLGQLMNLEPTKAVGGALHQQADNAQAQFQQGRDRALQRTLADQRYREEADWRRQQAEAQREATAAQREFTQQNAANTLDLRRGQLEIAQAAEARQAETARRTAEREAEEARTRIESSINTSNRILGTIDSLRNHPGLKDAVGALGAVRRMVPRSEALDFATIEEQLTGQNFLEAFQGLKGGGPITDLEGRKATEARSRLRTAQSPEQYLRALAELEDLVREVVSSNAASAERRGLEGIPAPRPPSQPVEPAQAAPQFVYDAQGRRVRQ